MIRLRQAQENLRWGLNEAIDELVTDGAMIAQQKYGSMANAVGYMPDETTGIIATSGKANIIAEFGAGDATLPPLGMFENEPDTPVYPGSYSELHAKQYVDYGEWEFPPGSGNWMSEVEPRYGLYNAKNYIEKNSTRIVKEVVEL
jgi:hypothetical protein